MSALCQCGCGGQTPVATRTRPYLGLVKGQPIRFLNGHARRLQRLGLDRWEERDTGHDTPCWLWLGQIAADTGYGLVWVDDEATATRRKLGAHRVMYQRQHGLIPTGLHLDHLCRVRACVNPAHLEAVTHAENNRRGAGTKLTREQVRQIKATPRTYGSSVALARTHGISVHQIRAIRDGRSWRDAA